MIRAGRKELGVSTPRVVEDEPLRVHRERRGSAPPAAVDLYWIPLGAGHHVVRLSGRLYESIMASIQRRHALQLYHSALTVEVPEGRFVIEQAPVVDVHGEGRGVVVEGPVGTRPARRLRWFRYEIRRWREGVIPDIAEAVRSPIRIADDLDHARLILELVPSVPPLVWGRDERDTGDMWNSNSVISWLLTRSGIDAGKIPPPPGGRAPGWSAGVAIAGYYSTEPGVVVCRARYAAASARRATSSFDRIDET